MRYITNIFRWKFDKEQQKRIFLMYMSVDTLYAVMWSVIWDNIGMW